MLCRTCRAEIADKALICYRCGAPTTDAKYQPALVTSDSRLRLIWIVSAIVALAVLVAFALWYGGR
jgi:hypothetical protein